MGRVLTQPPPRVGSRGCLKCQVPGAAPPAGCRRNGGHCTARWRSQSGLPERALAGRLLLVRARPEHRGPPLLNLARRALLRETRGLSTSTRSSSPKRIGGEARQKDAPPPRKRGAILTCRRHERQVRHRAPHWLAARSRRPRCAGCRRVGADRTTGMCRRSAEWQAGRSAARGLRCASRQLRSCSCSRAPGRWWAATACAKSPGRVPAPFRA